MEKFINGQNPELDADFVDSEIATMLNKKINGWPSLVIAGAAAAKKQTGPSISRSERHGDFDNDSFTLNSVLFRILKQEPKRLFTTRDLQ